MHLARRAALVVATVGALGGCGSTADPGYSSERRDAFLAACEQQASPEACACTWDRIVDEVPAERFVAVSERLAAGDALPEDLADLAVQCATAAVLG